MAQLALDRRRGVLIDVADAEAASLRVAETIVRKLEALPSLASEVASVATRDGVEGLRRFLRERVKEMRDGLADAMGGFASAKSD